MIDQLQVPVPDNTQHSIETDFHAFDGIRARSPSKLAAAHPRLGPRGHWHLILCVCVRMYRLYTRRRRRDYV